MQDLVRGHWLKVACNMVLEKTIPNPNTDRVWEVTGACYNDPNVSRKEFINGIKGKKPKLKQSVGSHLCASKT